MVELSKNSVSAITRRLREIPRPDRTGKGNPPRVREVSFWARITDVDADGAHDWTRVFAEHDAVDGLKFEDWPVETMGTANAYALGGQHVAAGTIVRLHLVTYDADGGPVYAFQGSGSMFPVTVTQTGGAAGNATTACTFTYTVTAIDEKELGTAVAVAWLRPIGKMLAAEHGVAYYDAAGDLVLWQVDEQPDITNECEA